MASTSTRAESSTSSSSLPPQYYDVFLSFRGEDTRRNFTDHLYSALVRHGFSTFRDDDELKTGEEIGPELLNSIERSTISVIVFSKNYADSRWCLDELVKILECKRTFRRMVLPVFYHVDPSDIRAQKGSFAEAFAKHEKRYEGRGMEGKLEEWRAALTQASNLSGWDLQNVADGHEAKFIERIVEDISNKLNLPYLNVADYPVGIESRVQYTTMLLRLELDDVRMVGIWGIGGIGKTTIAKAIYNTIHRKFDGSSFLANVREISKHTNGLVGLQEQLLSDIRMNENRNIRNVDQGIVVIKQRLWCRKVLVVLDDVDDISQLKQLAIRRDWFHSGSRIIVTTRDESLLKQLEVDEVYMPELLNEFESLQLFKWHAFREDYPIGDYVELSREVVRYAGGLPLVLEVLGPFFKGMDVLEWKSALESLKVIPHGHIESKLRISFDSLNDEEKALFLDISCFFVGMHQIYMEVDHGFFPINVLGVLSRRCLIKIKSGLFTMHDMLRDMGRGIVRKEHNEPGRRSRLWFHEDVLDVLTNHTGTEAVESLVINLDSSNNVPQVNAQAFATMNRLRLLEFSYVPLCGSYKHDLFKKLRWLCWFGFPLKSIPSNFLLEQVVVIDMRYSDLKQVWKGSKVLKKLKILNLSHSYHLIETPDFSGCTSLETLLLNDCIRLVKVHQSIKCLDKLLVLNLENCKNLRKLSLGIWNLTSLRSLSLSGCSKLGKLLGSQGALSKSLLSLLSSWSLSGRNPNSISHSPTSIQGLVSLRTLNMAHCNLSYIPDELGALSSLEKLSLEGNNFCSLPTSISHLSRLQLLQLYGCPRVESLPELPASVVVVDARECTSLERIPIGSNFQRPPHFTSNGSHKLERKLIRSNHRGSPHLCFDGCHKLAENNTASDFVESLLLNQELSAVGEFEIILPGGEIPDCFNWQSVGSDLSSPASLVLAVDRKIRGLILCIVCAFSEDDPNYRMEFGYLRYEVKNKTKGMTEEFDPMFEDSHQDQTWLYFVPQPYPSLDIEVGDEVEFLLPSLRGQYQLAEKWGVYLIGEDGEKDDPSSDQAMIQYASPSCRDDILDKELEANQAVAGTKISRHSYVYVHVWLGLLVCLLCLCLFVWIYGKIIDLTVVR